MYWIHTSIWFPPSFRIIWLFKVLFPVRSLVSRTRSGCFIGKRELFGGCKKAEPFERAPSDDRNSLRAKVVGGWKLLLNWMKLFYQRSKMQNILNTSELRYNMYEMSLSLHEKNALKSYLNIYFVVEWIVNIIEILPPPYLLNSRNYFSFVFAKILMRTNLILNNLFGLQWPVSVW